VLAAHFDDVQLVYTINNAVEHPSLGWRSLLTERNKPLALLRWASTFVLQTACFTCRRR
jgi:hypothetical protein